VKAIPNESEARAPHAAEREQAILDLLGRKGFIAFRDLEREIGASPATLRRDLERLAGHGRITRVHGGARLAGEAADGAVRPRLQGVPFHENIVRTRRKRPHHCRTAKDADELPTPHEVLPAFEDRAAVAV
jgi:DeoR family ulaG and ulaABCDEF operon transcriptional repressor